MNTGGRALKWVTQPYLWCWSRDVTSLQERRGKNPSGLTLFPASVSHWLNNVLSWSNGARDAVNKAEHPGAKRRLKGWRMALEGQMKGIQLMTKISVSLSICALILGTRDWHLPSASTWMEFRAMAAANLQHLLKKLRVEITSEAFCALGKTGVFSPPNI